GAAVSISTWRGATQSYGVAGHQGQTAMQVTIGHPGRYLLRATNVVPDSITDVAVGRGIGRGMLIPLVLSLVALFAFIPAGLLVGGITFFRRRRARRDLPAALSAPQVRQPDGNWSSAASISSPLQHPAGGHPDLPGQAEDVLDRRIGAAFIDIALMAGLFAILSLAVGPGWVGGARGGFGFYLGPAWSLVYLALVLLYYFTTEAATGQTVGKRLLGVRVVRRRRARIRGGDRRAHVAADHRLASPLVPDRVDQHRGHRAAAATARRPRGWDIDGAGGAGAAPRSRVRATGPRARGRRTPVRLPRGLRPRHPSH